MKDYEIRGEVLKKAKPCKIHHVMPTWEEDELSPMLNGYYPTSKQYRLVCRQCEWERIEGNYKPEIDRWNKNNE